MCGYATFGNFCDFAIGFRPKRYTHTKPHTHPPTQQAPRKKLTMPPTMSGSPPRVGGAAAGAPAQAGLSPFEQKRLEAKQKMEEMNRQRSEAEAKRAAYQEWLKQNELDSTGDAAYDGITVTDMGVTRTQAWTRTLDDGPDPPNGRASMVNGWKTELLVPDFSNFAARQSVRQGVEDGVLTKQIGFDKHGTFHPVRHFHAGSAYERYRRGMPPGYMGHIPQDAVPGPAATESSRSTRSCTRP